jgi:hypothetical protein
VGEQGGPLADRQGVARAIGNVRQTHPTVAEEQAIPLGGLLRDVLAGTITGGVTVGGRLAREPGLVALDRVDPGARIRGTDTNGETTVVRSWS